MNQQTKDKLILSRFTRSSEWPKLRRKWLKWHSECEVCGVKRRLVAHHIIPHHIAPEGELDITNLISLCERHHLLFGHLNDFMSHNANVVTDAAIWHDRIKHRPKWRRSNG